MMVPTSLGEEKEMHKFSRAAQYQCGYYINHLDYVLNLRSQYDLWLLSKVCIVEREIREIGGEVYLTSAVLLLS